MAILSTAVVTPGRPWKHATLWLIALGPFFFLSYGFATWLTSQRPDVGLLVFAWERYIPFLPWTIVPYWSIDLLYGLSFFLCTKQAEVHVHGRRLLAAQVICVTSFLLYPLQFTFVRPATDGLFGLMFDVLGGFDKPFNQAPSLHIALLVILWVLYARYVQGLWRWVLHVWFLLIGVSVLTTYQHHFVDVPTGLWVGLFCLWIFPDSGRFIFAGARFSEDRQRRKLAIRYGVAALFLAAVAVYMSGWALWLLWAAGSLALVATIYGFLNETAFQKADDGSMSLATRWLFAPYLLAAWVNSRLWTRSVPDAVEIAPGILLGRLPTRKEREVRGVRAIVDLTAELPCDSEGAHYTNVPQLDLVVPSTSEVARSVRAIESHRKAGTLLVCCALGYSRSATAATAWLLASGYAKDLADAIGRIRRARPSIVLTPAHRHVLEHFANSCREVKDQAP